VALGTGQDACHGGVARLGVRADVDFGLRLQRRGLLQADLQLGPVRRLQIGGNGIV